LDFFTVNCKQRPVPPSNCTPPDALVLRKPLPDGVLRIVAKGEKEDGPTLWKGRLHRRLQRGVGGDLHQHLAEVAAA
jgi:hypothetical protein